MVRWEKELMGERRIQRWHYRVGSLRKRIPSAEIETQRRRMGWGQHRGEVSAR